MKKLIVLMLLSAGLAGKAQSRRVPGLITYSNPATPERQKADPADTLSAYGMISKYRRLDNGGEIIDTFYTSRKYMNGFYLVGDTAGVTKLRSFPK